MSVLSDKDIFQFLKDKDLKISPLMVDQIQPASVDLRLGAKAKTLQSGSVNLRNFDKATLKWQEVDLEQGYALKPGGWIQAWTLEKIELPNNLNAKIFGKNSLVILGLDVQVAFINPGFTGLMCLSIKNWSNASLTIGAGMGICQIEFATLEQTPTRGYRGGIAHVPDNDTASSLFSPGEKQDNMLSRFLREQIDSMVK